MSLEPGEVLECSHCLSAGEIPQTSTLLDEQQTSVSLDEQQASALLDEQQLTSTPSRPSFLNNNRPASTSEFVIQNGSYNGHVQHRDGSLIGERSYHSILV